MTLAILHVQHHRTPRAPGAAHDLDADGVIQYDETERWMAQQYAFVAADRLLARGVYVDVLDPVQATYRAMHDRALALAREHRGPVVYVACHVNAGGGDYGMVGFDRRSALGKQAATTLSLALGALPELSAVHVRPLYDDRGGPDAPWLYRGWGCIAPIYRGPANVCGLLFEPFFLDCARHRELTTDMGLIRVGEALAAGVATHLGEMEAS